MVEFWKIFRYPKSAILEKVSNFRNLSSLIKRAGTAILRVVPALAEIGDLHFLRKLFLTIIFRHFPRYNYTPPLGQGFIG